MRLISSTLAVASTAALVSWSAPAEAGGLGVSGIAGFRQAPAYFYDEDLDQGIDWQSRPSMGFGIDTVLGDKDNRILGIARFSTLVDSPLNEPDLSGEEGDTSLYTYPAAHEEDPVTVGVISVGVQWGVYGDPTGFQLVLSSMAGSGFLTSDNQEFFLLEPGVGATWTTNDRFQFYGVANYQLRFRKSFSQGANAVAGVRYLFD